MAKQFDRRIPVEGGEVKIRCVKRWRTASVWFDLSNSPYRLTREQQDSFRSLAPGWLVTAESVHALNAKAKEADSLAEYFEGFLRDRVLSEPPIDGAELERTQKDPWYDMPTPGEWFMAFKVAGYILWENYALSDAIKRTTHDVDAGKKWVPQRAVSRVASYIATGSPERPGPDELPSYMIEEREALEACVLQLVTDPEVDAYLDRIREG